MKKLKPILLAAAALGGLALMAAVALLDLPGGITGLMCGLAAVIYASRMTAVAASNAGLNFEMDAIAAVAIGGTSMAGGRGKIVGTFVGVLMFRIISNILTAADVSTFLNGAISAAIIVIAVLLQGFQNHKK